MAGVLAKFLVLGRVNEVMAIGYLTPRGAGEATCYVTSAILMMLFVLLLVPVSAVMSAGSGTASPVGLRLGIPLIDSDANTAVRSVVFCLGGIMVYALLYQSRIVPRWIAVWGLAAIPLYLVAFLLATDAVSGQSSSVLVMMVLPLAVLEMALGNWMIARGFRPAADTTTPEHVHGTLVRA